ncbi:MAG TPA: 6-bladed beta-propeller, partial [Terriglobales bacterium]
KGSRAALFGLQGPPRQKLRPAEVPSGIDLHPIERVVDDYEPSTHVIKAAKGRSSLAAFRDRLITLVYGRESVLQAPTHVITDSRQRLIVTDPALPAVHVLDFKGKNSFRIAGGPRHRLQAPNGVAVDGDDNIYVADGKKGVILVYDPQGQFLRYIGSFRGESLFQSPTGIAIDRNAGHLYVLDSPSHQVIMLDLQGKVIKKAGDRRNPTRSADYPTEIALSNQQLVVLDAGSRLQLFDLECNLLKTFAIRPVGGPPLLTELGLALDSYSNIYISNLDGSTVRVYSPDGRLLTIWGRQGFGLQEFDVPSGLWIDSTDRMYVADTRNSRIQVFQIPNPGGPGIAQAAERNR